MDSPRLKQTTKTATSAEFPPRQTVTKVPAQPRTPLKAAAKAPEKSEGDGLARLLKQYEYGPIEFAGSSNATFERHLIFDNVNSVQAAGPRERFEAFARSVRDILSQRWVRTEETYARENPK